MTTLGIFMGAQYGNNEQFDDSARLVAQTLNKLGWSMVYGGSGTGLMAEVARTAHDLGVHVTGVHPDTLLPESADEGILSEFIRVPDMDARKRKMFELADAFLFLPGGMGTLEEFAQAISWTKLGFYDKPIVLLNIDGYYDELAAWILRAIEEDFVAQVDIKQYAIVDSVPLAFEHIQNSLGI
jgi:uncharacterized protein (TIGR00730 family)